MKKLISKLLFSQITQSPPAIFVGAMQDISNATQIDLLQSANSLSSAGGMNFQASAAATITLTQLGNLMQQLTNGGAVTVTLDSAYNIGRFLPQPLSIGQQFTFQLQSNAGTTVATPTLSDTAVTLAGTTSLLAAALRWYLGTISQVYSTTGSLFTSGTTFTSLTQVGSTNHYTVVLGTNSISPVVGNLIYIGTTAGTLPAGWYPIIKVTSATSFVIAAPPSGTAWTCTAATIGAGNPSTPIYSPLMTITGVMSTVTAIMSV